MSYKVINISGGDLHYQGLRYTTGGSEQIPHLDQRHRKLEEKKLVSILNLMDDLNEQEFMPAGEDPSEAEVAPEVIPTSGAVNAELNTQQTIVADSAGAGAVGGNSVSGASVSPQPTSTPAPSADTSKSQQPAPTGKPTK